MLPARTSWPPYFLTPNLLPAESLLLRVEPPPRFVADLCCSQKTPPPTAVDEEGSELGAVKVKGVLESKLELDEPVRRANRCRAMAELVVVVMVEGNWVPIGRMICSLLLTKMAMRWPRHFFCSSVC